MHWWLGERPQKRRGPAQSCWSWGAQCLCHAAASDVLNRLHLGLLPLAGDLTCVRLPVSGYLCLATCVWLLVSGCLSLSAPLPSIPLAVQKPRTSVPLIGTVSQALNVRLAFCYRPFTACRPLVSPAASQSSTLSDYSASLVCPSNCCAHPTLRTLGDVSCLPMSTFKGGRQPPHGLTSQLQYRRRYGHS